MKKVVLTLCALGVLGTVGVGCTYGGVAMSGEKAVVVRNNLLLLGLGSKAYVCFVTEDGLSQCKSKVNP